MELRLRFFLFMLTMVLVGVGVGAVAVGEGGEAPPQLPSSSSPPVMRLMTEVDCPVSCGDVAVPYPFGIKYHECALNDSFLLTCNQTNPAGPGSSNDTLWTGNIQVVNISVENGTMVVNLYTSYVCYESYDGLTATSNYYYNEVTLIGTPFTFSSTENKFTALGCNTVAYVGDSEGGLFENGCISLCNHEVNLTAEGSCSGVGCCQTQIPSGLKALNMSILPVNRNQGITPSINFSRCSYSFLAKQDWFGFFTIDLSDNSIDAEGKVSRAVFDWAVGDGTCEAFDPSSSSYACANHTSCVNYGDGPGYRCQCKPGYQGNPYLPPGCKDINECMDRERYPCEGTCRNTPGNYTCRCPLGMSGDGKVACKGFRFTTIATVCGAGTSVVIILVLLLMLGKRRVEAINFRQNGGSLLKSQNIRIFTAQELKKATTNYSRDKLLGKGGSATVYKGVLDDGSLVAVKKPNDGTQVQHFEEEVVDEQFHREIAILSQVNHKNVVKLLGLCLQTKVPILVYEFVSNGTLSRHLHQLGSNLLRSWTNRLRIAAETALALDYLHSLAHPPIIHRDVKSSNILLDQNFTAKVSDFGASVWIPPGQTGVVTKLLGTLGYWDPEYLVTGNLTPKSDVYSFGVVLMELLTGQKPISKEETEEANYIEYFISSVEEKRWSQVLDAGDEVGDTLGEMKEVADIARRCLNRSGLKRPTMKEVAQELDGIQKLHETFRSAWEPNSEETESLLPSPCSSQPQTFSLETDLYQIEFDSTSDTRP